ncbi:MAG: copper amine oxidase N-terminal domain-containing protein [Syntrophomonadaceae bacterium]|jgi:hypothetical protein|nr:copper amine oxidase N-terminal domain-containing protein [Syntrophomonadaceae bacterium]
MLRKTVRNKLMAGMLFIAMAAGVFAAPGAATAAEYAIMGDTPYVGSGTYDLGTVTVRAQGGSLDKDDVLIISLPRDFEIPDVNAVALADGNPVPGTAGALLVAPQTYEGRTNALFDIVAGGALVIQRYNGDNAVRLSFGGTANFSGFEEYFFYLFLRGITVPSGISGDITVTFTSNGGWGDGGQQVAKVSGSDSLTVEVSAGEAVSFSGTESAPVKLTFTESHAGALASGGKVKLRLPEGFAWKNPSGGYKAEYAQGDIPGLKLEVSADGREFTASAGAQASTRATAFSVTAELTTKDANTAAPGSVYAALSAEGGVRLSRIESLKIGVLEEEKTPEVTAPEEEAKTYVSLFTIDSEAYSVNGIIRQLDAPPYIRNDRTYLPVRYVADALGISGQDIIWNEAERTVTLIKGAKTVQLTIGSTEMLVNGVSVQMDTAPEIYQSRTMLPASWVAGQFGADVQWEADSRTVTISY